jgi:2-iminobutanoate/2-iminopropanoate deaminase
MTKRAVNPWDWQNRAGFSQAWRVDGVSALVFISGQAPVSADGQLVGANDFEAQTRQVLENLVTVVEEAGATLDNVVKLTVFLTDMGKLQEYTQIKREVFQGEPPASTAVEVRALARPEMLVEVEALAVL